jgi:histidine triad (HIT) family protein
MASIFTKIINGDIPCYKIAENDSCFAFLDINPLQKGHTLVVPKVEVDRYFDLEASILSELTLFSQQVARAIKKAYPCDRVGVAVIGLEVPHAHLHLIPINRMADMDFRSPKLQLSKEEFLEVVNNVRSFL